MTNNKKEVTDEKLSKVSGGVDSAYLDNLNTKINNKAAGIKLELGITVKPQINGFNNINNSYIIKDALSPLTVRDKQDALNGENEQETIPTNGGNPFR